MQQVTSIVLSTDCRTSLLAGLVTADTLRGDPVASGAMYLACFVVWCWDLNSQFAASQLPLLQVSDASKLE